MNKKRRKNSFLNQISRVFNKKKDDKLEQQSELDKQTKALDNRQPDNLENVPHNSGSKTVPLVVDKSESCTTAAKDNSFRTGERSHSDISDIRMQQNYENIISMQTDKSFGPDRDNNKGMEHKNDNVMKNVHEECKLEADRHMSKKIAFLRQDNNLHTTSQSYLKNANNRTEDFSSDSKSTTLQPCSSNVNVTNNIRALVVKETKEICQENSEDSDFSADSTENSFEESSEDENDLIESEKAQKYFKDEYFTKGKYMTYFFLEMERQFYNPSDVYSMVQYCNTEREKPEKEGIK